MKSIPDQRRLLALLTQRFVPGEADILAAVLELPVCDDAAALVAAADRAERLAELEVLIERHRPAVAGSFAAVHYVQGGLPLPVISPDRRHRVEFHGTEELPRGRLAYGARLVGPSLQLVLVPRRFTGRATWAPAGGIVEVELWRLESIGKDALVPVAMDEGLRVDLARRRIAHRLAGTRADALSWTDFEHARCWLVEARSSAPPG